MPVRNLPIIDSHVHLPIWKGNFTGNPLYPQKVKEISTNFNKYRSMEQAKWRSEWNFPPPDHSITDPLKLGELWYSQCLEYNIEKVIFVTGGGNENLAKVISHWPDKFAGLVHHHPEDSKALENLITYVEKYNFKGYKMLSQRITVPWDHEALKEIWEYLNSHSLPCLIHFGVGGGAGGIGNHSLIDPLTLFDMAQKYYKIPFIIPHFGAGYFKEALQLSWTCPNVYIDTSGSNQWMKWLPYHLDVKSAIAKSMETIGSERLIFGTDSSWFPRGFANEYLESQLKYCYELGLTPLDINNIFYNNVNKIYNL